MIIVDQLSLAEFYETVKVHVDADAFHDVFTSMQIGNASALGWSSQIYHHINSGYPQNSPVEDLADEVGDYVFDPCFLASEVMPRLEQGRDSYLFAWAACCLLILPLTEARLCLATKDLEPALALLEFLNAKVHRLDSARRLFLSIQASSPEFTKLINEIYGDRAHSSQLDMDFSQVIDGLRSFIRLAAQMQSDVVQGLLDKLDLGEE